MSSKKQPAKAGVCKGKKEAITVEVKKEIIAKHERGIRVVDLAREYGRALSTISTILKGKDKYKTLDVAKGVSKLTSKCPKLLEDVEWLLLMWMNERQLHGDCLSEAIVCAKARMLYVDLVRKIPGALSEDEEVFRASRGWFENFKKKSGIHSVVRHGEAASSDKGAAEAFVPEFQKFVDQQFLPQQVFNCDETGLFWKKLTKRTYITQEEQSLPGHKPMKDRLTLVLCANASGDCKVKPLLVYHSENPRVFKAFKVHKTRLNVLWRSNKRSWVTQIFFSEWVNDVFGPTVRNYLVDKQLPLKALLVLDNAPAHPRQLQDDLFPENQFITIKFLPPNTTPLLQPMDQQVIANFKKLYMKALLERCVHRDFEGFGPAPASASAPVDDLEALLVDDIVALGHTLGLEVDAADVQELVEEHSDELTTEELLELQKELVQQEVQELSSGEEEVCEDAIPSSEIRDVLGMFEKVTAFAEKHHPDKAVTTRCVNLFNDNVLSRFRDILKRRQQQVTRDMVSGQGGKRRASDIEPQPGPSGVKFPKRVSPPDPEVVSPSSP
ncbi:tigger transposable element-derived protein 1-like [Procambarus clarkii]|uniref:tigger transposable element-derived protein 1-like n=1 Tax=Procambarus clarkii TaxID=6728 RepID=UPI003743806F